MADKNSLMATRKNIPQGEDDDYYIQATSHDYGVGCLVQIIS